MRWEERLFNPLGDAHMKRRKRGRASDEEGIVVIVIREG